jgi:sulfur-oxidizing protein SoxZ
MADPMKIRARLDGDITDVRIIVAHEMETGLRKDSAGNVIPAHFITILTVTHNARTVFTTQWGPAVAKNPFLGIKFKGAKAGDKVQVTWVDNKGDTRTDEGTIN